jgi:hypothetical protein
MYNIDNVQYIDKMVTMVTMGGDLQPGCLTDRLLTGLWPATSRSISSESTVKTKALPCRQEADRRVEDRGW